MPPTITSYMDLRLISNQPVKISMWLRSLLVIPEVVPAQVPVSHIKIKLIFTLKYFLKYNQLLLQSLITEKIKHYQSMLIEHQQYVPVPQCLCQCSDKHYNSQYLIYTNSCKDQELHQASKTVATRIFYLLKQY